MSGITRRVIQFRVQVLRLLVQVNPDHVVGHCCFPHRWFDICCAKLQLYQMLKISSWPARILLLAAIEHFHSLLIVSQTRTLLVSQ